MVLVFSNEYIIISILYQYFITTHSHFHFTEQYFEKKRLNETSSTFMKFPNDVRQAEHMVGGNPNIVDDEKFQPKKPVPAQSK